MFNDLTKELQQIKSLLQTNNELLKQLLQKP